MNDDTIYQGNAAQQSNESKKGTSGFKAAVAKSWKPVTIGGVTGILMGGGVLLAGSHLHAAENTDQASVMYHNAPEASSVSDDMSFAEAFAAARAQVGPGGVFQWHGAVFNTYTAEEWQAMSEAEQQAFAQQVQTEVPADHVNAQHIASTPHHTEHHEAAQHHETAHHDDPNSHHDDPNAPHDDPNAHSTGGNTAQTVQEQGQSFEVEGVRIVGYGEMDGHTVVGYDANGDNDPDVAIIDVDDSGGITDPDVIMDSDGNMATIGEVRQAAAEDYQDSQSPDQQVYASNPDVAEDGMPDYMDDGMIDA